MIIYLALIIPIVVTFVFYLFYKRNFVWWEFFIPIGIALIAVVASKLITEHLETSFDEYWGSTVVEARYYEDWNEYIHQTCTETTTDSDGNTTTTTYDCSYVDYHPEYWEVYTTSDETIDISESEYNKIKSIFGNIAFVELDRNYYTDDGDMYKTNWDKSYKKNIPVTTKHTYINKVKASDVTVFNISVIDESEADSLKLYDYPKLNDYFNYPTILGYCPHDTIVKKFNKLNAIYGPSNHLRLWILVFNTPNHLIGLQQENYWVRGNKNELVLCMGIDSTSKKVNWTHVFSWSPSEDLKIELRDYSSKITHLNDSTLNNLNNYLFPNLKTFEKRSFEEFDYITVEPSMTAVIVSYIIVLIISIGVNVWVVKNEIEDNENKYPY